MITAENLKWINPSIRQRSISSENCIRVIKAKEQYNMDCVNPTKIIKLVNEYLDSLHMLPIENPQKEPKDRELRRFDYAKYKKIYKLKDKRDIVWIKFTKNKQHIGVIGTGCDINFNYNTTSGKIISYLNETWYEKNVLIFPLINIPDGLNRSDIESGIGNYLISKNIPILDFYSHNF